MPVVRRVIQPILFLLARSTHTELARQVQFLQEENRILRSRLPSRVIVTPTERERLLRVGIPLGPALNHLISIVKPITFQRWVRSMRGTEQVEPRRAGRPRTPEQVRGLILRLARENEWGYTRILGELRKLGIKDVSRSTVRNILVGGGLDPAARRRGPSWDEFMTMHAETLWSCDFVGRWVWTLRGKALCFMLVFMHPASRRVIVSEATNRPNSAWAAEQAVRFCEEAERSGLASPTIVLRDRDEKFGALFDAALKRRGIEPQVLPFRAPNLNAHVERFIQSLAHECLERFIIFGPRHMEYLVGEFVAHYHEERPHQANGNRPLFGTGPPSDAAAAGGSRIVCKRRLGGLLKHYERVAA